MATKTGTRSGAATQVVAWRREQLLAGKFGFELADQLAADWRFDLHALIQLVEQGCDPALAVRILWPLDDDEMLLARPREIRRDR